MAGDSEAGAGVLGGGIVLNRTGGVVRRVFLATFIAALWCGGWSSRLAAADGAIELTWDALPALPNALGVAGPYSGVHGDVLIVAGGANFPQPVWDNEKEWHADIYVLVDDEGEGASALRWVVAGQLDRPRAYGACVSIVDGVVCMGGNDGPETFADVFLLQWDANQERVTQVSFPSLPAPCAYGAATVVGDVIYLAGGQSDDGLASAMCNLWSLDLSKRGDAEAFVWRELDSWPGPPRAFNLVASQHNGFHNAVYVMSGRRESDSEPGSQVEFLRDVWEYTPATETWRQRADAPRSVMAGTAMSSGQSHIFVLSGADGSLFTEADRLRDEHPGFPKEALAYHTITDTWTSAGAMPQNQVTSHAVRWRDEIVIASGEVRPRVRTPGVWRITVKPATHAFGVINYTVLFAYLLSMVGIGVYFVRRTRNTDDYFRGGQHIPWWAAGCSIFATMLSSLTYTGIPSKAYAQDWVYSMGNMMIPVVAIVAALVAMPFFRRIDATSAYEYLEKRFSRGVRWFGSASFTLFHVFRMAVVMSLTGLALAVATPLTPTQSVVLMGTLSIVYCTMGGIEAVIWTDTIQTVVLMGGAGLALILLIMGVEGGWEGFYASAREADKFRIANWHWDATSSQIALWVIVVGAIAQNVSSYTADQAVVQRYMTTADQRLAARSIWTNAVLVIPTTVIFFAMGSALFAFYQSHPEKLEPTITTDQIFPLFIAREMPVGIAGILVAGIFAAAQSTVSTSMNSTATTLVTDFMKPLGICRSDAGYLRAARLTTLLIGVVGTLLGLCFVSPEIRSLFDAFIKVIGLFMGVLGGLFLLGALSTRASAMGALTGAFVGAAVMASMWLFTPINGYLYTASGIGSCLVTGWIASWMLGSPPEDLSGLTIYTLGSEQTPQVVSQGSER